MDNYTNTIVPKAVILEYIWVGGKGEFRSKYKTVYESLDNKISIPTWNYDGSSTSQAEGKNSDILLKPVNIFPNPFVKWCLSFIVLCECYNKDNTEWFLRSY